MSSSSRVRDEGTTGDITTVTKQKKKKTTNPTKKERAEESYPRSFARPVHQGYLKK